MKSIALREYKPASDNGIGGYDEKSHVKSATGRTFI